jgi:hypothetical protein
MPRLSTNDAALVLHAIQKLVTHVDVLPERDDLLRVMHRLAQRTLQAEGGAGARKPGTETAGMKPHDAAIRRTSSRRGVFDLQHLNRAEVHAKPDR